MSLACNATQRSMATTDRRSPNKEIDKIKAISFHEHLSFHFDLIRENSKTSYTL
ncbi:hypothetical protein IFVP408_C170292 [Vibrio parahaemolyticus]